MLLDGSFSDCSFATGVIPRMILKKKSGFAAILAALTVAGACTGSAAAHEVSISSPANGSTISVSVNPEVHAGAINSLVFRGVEYVDNYDHGRQIQTAIQVDNLGECFNPTEAGSRADAAKRRTSSVILAVSNADNTLRTETKPAFWLSPKEPYGKVCSEYRSEKHAQNETVLSNYKIARTTRFYGPTIPNMLLVDVSVTMPERRKSAVIEALTGYLPGSFSTFYSYDPRSRRLHRLLAGPNEGRVSTSVIVATPDGRNAMGVFSPAISNVKSEYDFYSYYYFSGVGATAKWSCRFGEFDVQRGTTLKYSCLIAVGTVKEVAAAFDAYASDSRR